jgi:6-phosphogluconolactonase/glucosamine-6-phosphate isomerase/deaminase
MTAQGTRIAVLAPEDWAPAVATAFVDRVAARPDLRVCLPTGETPAPLYASIVAAEHRGAVSLAAATVVMLDEWLGLPPGDPARGEAILRRELIDRLRSRPAQFATIDADGPDPAAAAAGLDREAIGLDLAILGLGINGHVGFNEPGSGPDAATRVVELAETSRQTATGRYGASVAPRAGITIGLARLLEAGEVWLLVTGGQKARVLRRALHWPESPSCPASYLRRHPLLTVFADEPAAAMLPGRERDARREII